MHAKEAKKKWIFTSIILHTPSVAIDYNNATASAIARPTMRPDEAWSALAAPVVLATGMGAPVVGTEEFEVVLPAPVPVADTNADEDGFDDDDDETVLVTSDNDEDKEGNVVCA